jgi:probable HAF family extracellular repeat protein
MTHRTLALVLCAFVTNAAVAVSSAQEPASVSGFKDVNAPGAIETDTKAINKLGVIAGDYEDKSGVQHGMILNGKQLTSVSRKNCVSAHGFTAISFYGIISKDIVVGWCQDTKTGLDDAFSYFKGKFTTISPPGAMSTQANGINDKGQIVGTYIDSADVQHGFLLSGTTYTTLDVTGGDTNSAAMAINIKGLITLTAFNGSSYDSFLFDGESYTMINVPGEADSFVAGIDSFGDRIYSVVDSSDIIHGAFFLNVKGGTYTVFNDPKGQTDTQAFGLNDTLRIVGTYAPSGGRMPSDPGYEAHGCCRGVPPDGIQSH